MITINSKLASTLSVVPTSVNVVTRFPHAYNCQVVINDVVYYVKVFDKLDDLPILMFETSDVLKRYKLKIPLHRKIMLYPFNSLSDRLVLMDLVTEWQLNIGLVYYYTDLLDSLDTLQVMLKGIKCKKLFKTLTESFTYQVV